MFVKIFCGDSQKYLLLQSNNVTLDKKKRVVNSDLYPIISAFIDTMATSCESQNYEKIKYLNTVWNKLHEIRYENENTDCEIIGIESFISRMIPNTPYELMVPVLSDSQEAEKLDHLSESPSGLDVPASILNVEISCVTVDENTYFTTGSIFVMNDDGKTIDRI